MFLNLSIVIAPAAGIKYFTNLLFVQARKQSEDTQKALANAENSHQRAKDLDTEAQNLLTKIKGKNTNMFLLIRINL